MDGVGGLRSDFKPLIQLAQVPLETYSFAKLNQNSEDSSHVSAISLDVDVRFKSTADIDSNGKPPLYPRSVPTWVTWLMLLV